MRYVDKEKNVGYYEAMNHERKVKIHLCTKNTNKFSSPTHTKINLYILSTSSNVSWFHLSDLSINIRIIITIGSWNY